MTDPFIASDKRNTDRSSEGTPGTASQVKKPISTGQVMQHRQNPNSQMKQGTKISFRSFMIGCFIFGLFLLLAGGFVIYSLMNSPDALEKMGISIETMRRLLTFFSVLFFGILFFASFIMLLINLYRLSTVRSGKTKFAVGGGISFVFLAISLVFGAIVMTNISSLRPAGEIKTNQVVDGFVLGGSGFETLYGQFAAIAPSEMNFRFNVDNFQKGLGNKIGNMGNVGAISLDCGNGKILNLDKGSLKFIGSCLFEKKGDYKLTLNYNYMGTQGTMIDDKLELGNITMNAEIELSLEDGKINLSDNLDELIVGEAPVNLTLNSNKLFSDLKIPGKPEISWDLDGDGKQDSTSILTRFTYDTPQLYNVIYTLPQLSKDHQYLIRLRVNQSDIPQCNLTVIENKIGHKIQAQVDKSYTIKDYRYELVEVETGEVKDSFKKSTSSTVYKIKTPGKYEIRLTAVTADNKKSFCKSSVIDTTTGEYKPTYTIYSKLREDKDYAEIQLVDGKIPVERIPTDYRIDIDNIVGGQGNELVKISLNDDEINETDDRVYEFSIEDNNKYSLNIIVIDENNRESNSVLEFDISETPLIGVIKATPHTGEDPLTVELDASTSQINDPEDEIIYFTWNFGDGQVMKNVSLGKITHKYRFDNDKESGVYNPSVEILTKKGHKQVVKLSDPIIVKRAEKSIKISFDSHPAQTARVDDPVRFSVVTDGSVKNVSWEFGDGKVLECDSRECMNANTTYDKPGLYTITVSVEYDDYPLVTKTEKIKIIE